ncbi:Heavy metal-associated isoprenylated plant protein 41, partial [Mucuna pruriens]
MTGREEEDNDDDDLHTYHDDDDDNDDDLELEDEESAKAEKWKKHYSSRHRILFVGEGDFSFSLCLARAFGSAHNLVATSLDSHENVGKKYSNGLSNVMELEEKGCLVLHGVDAKEMNQHFFLKTQRFDRIVFNFPHVGFLYPENSYCQIQLNKRLLKGFLANAKALVKKEGGEIHVTHKEGDPYNKWDLVQKAEKRGLVLQEVVPFFKNDYPGYDNKRAHGKLSDAAFAIGEASTYKFKVQTSSTCNN